MRKFWAPTLIVFFMMSLSASAMGAEHGKFCKKSKTYRDKTTFIALFDFGSDKKEIYPAIQSDADAEQCNGSAPAPEKTAENHG